MKINDIKPNPANPRKIKAERMAKLIQSIEQFPAMMELRPIIVGADGVILGGNMRYKALKKMGYKELPEAWVRRADSLTEEEKRRFILADNIAFGENDWQDLADNWDLTEAQEWGLELPDEWGDEKGKNVKEDNYQVPQEIETEIKLGDIIEIGRHRLMCGDSTDKAQVELLMNGKKADMVFTDPPYNVDYHSADGKSIENDNLSDGDFYHFLLSFYKVFAAVTKPGGAWYVWHADSEGANFRRAFIDAGLLLKQCLVWVKNTFVLGRSDYHWQHEPCLYGWAPGAAHYFTVSRTESTVIDDTLDLKKLSKAELYDLLQEITKNPNQKTTVLRFDKPTKSEEHPTMKPILLIAPLIENSSIAGGLIVDPFLGSGSTMVACQQLQRVCYGLELDPAYCQVIVDRMLKLDPKLTLKINGERRT